MSASDALVPAAQVFGIVGSSILAGMIACFSYAAIPPISQAPPEIAVLQWRTAYEIGKSTSPPFALTAAGSFAYLAYSNYRLRSLKTSSKATVDTATVRMAMYAAAAVLIPSIVPYTLLRMEPMVNSALMDMANLAETGSAVGKTAGEVSALFVKWSGMNYVRAALVCTGSLLGAVASLAY